MDETIPRENMRKEDGRLNIIFQQLLGLKSSLEEMRAEQKNIAIDVLHNKEKTDLLTLRQYENVVPMLESIRKKLFGNGVAGLLEEHIICKNKLAYMESDIQDIKSLRTWIRNLTVTTGVSIILGLIAIVWRYH